MSDYERRKCYNLQPIVLTAIKTATFQIIEEFETLHPKKIFDIEELMLYLDEMDDEIIRFFHDLALQKKRDKHIAAVRTITGKSLSTIERRVN